MTDNNFVGPVKRILVIYPKAILEQIDDIAKQQHRSRSDCMREMARQWLDRYEMKQHEIFHAMTKKREALADVLPLPKPIEAPPRHFFEE